MLFHSFFSSLARSKYMSLFSFPLIFTVVCPEGKIDFIVDCIFPILRWIWYLSNFSVTPFSIYLFKHFYFTMWSVEIIILQFEIIFLYLKCQYTHYVRIDCYWQASNLKETWAVWWNKTGFLSSYTYISTSVQLHHFKKKLGGSYKNAACCFEQILAVLTYKRVPVQPLTSHLTNHPCKTRKICWWLLEKKGSTNKWLYPMDSYTWTHHRWPTSNSIHASALCGQWMPSRGHA